MNSSFMLASTFFRRPGRADAPFRVCLRLFVILLPLLALCCGREVSPPPEGQSMARNPPRVKGSYPTEFWNAVPCMEKRPISLGRRSVDF